jgi:hypothetical protein
MGFLRSGSDLWLACALDIAHSRRSARDNWTGAARSVSSLPLARSTSRGGARCSAVRCGAVRCGFPDRANERASVGHPHAARIGERALHVTETTGDGVKASPPSLLCASVGVGAHRLAFRSPCSREGVRPRGAMGATRQNESKLFPFVTRQWGISVRVDPLSSMPENLGT